jgi:hypothetical protein
MKKKNSILKLFTLISVSLVLFSCLDDPEPVALDFVPDVFVQKVTDNGQELYAPAFLVFGNKALESGTLEGPSGGNWTLENDSADSRILNLLPEDEDFTATMPETGTYSFTVTSTQTDEAPVTLTDILEDAELDAVVIDTTEFNNSEMTTSWQSVSGTDMFLLRLYDESGQLIYISDQITANQTDYTVRNFDGNWLSSNMPEDGESYVVELLAILYEQGTSSGNMQYNIQFISIGTSEIVWGE